MLAFMADVAHLKPGCVYLDVGANTGQHVIFMSQLADRVHAFEPWDEAINVLKGQIESNRLDNVTVHACALGSESVMATYYPPTDSNRGVGSFVESFADAVDGATLQYPIERGDEVVEREIDHFDLIKIDTEGFEREVIRGLGRSFERYRPVMVVELSHNTDESFQTLTELAAGLPADYVLYGIQGVHNGYRYRLCALDDANWEQFLDIVAMPAELTGSFAERVRRYPFYSKPSDIPRMLRARLARRT